ncbi:MAG: ATP phosphoribosyltransferase regulatory subunit [Gammaproteobacteria bacterium]|nr:ATP phosphoribosyltransferase regulatory subunit [Gammaproteobacteria bacterium]
MRAGNKWLLPEGIEAVLPPRAAQLDALCRRITDQFATWGYELVTPPLLEYLDTLFPGSDDELELQTFKVIDQLSGKLMGLRADTTPQVARIEVHHLKRSGPSRLCYIGPVLRTLPGGPGGARALLQVGAELYGHKGIESDAEILALLLKTLQLAGLREVHVDVGHVGVLRGLTKPMQLDPDREARLFSCVQRKATDELRAMLNEWDLSNECAAALLSLMEIEGDAGILEDVKTILKPCGETLCGYVDELEQIAQLTARQLSKPPLYFDVTEFQGYHYHTGMTFAAYVPGQSEGIAFGGRYDGVCAAFGRARVATGFSTDALKLFELAPPAPAPQQAIAAPVADAPGLHELVESLRAQGETVIYRLPGDEGAAACDRELVLEAGRWQVRYCQ